MSSVKRLFVEKRPGFDVEARHMLTDLRENLGITALDRVRVINRYDLEGVSGADLERAARTILSEPNVDTLSETLCVDPGWGIFAMEYLPARRFCRAVYRPAHAGRAAECPLRTRHRAAGRPDG